MATRRNWRSSSSTNSSFDDTGERDAGERDAGEQTALSSLSREQTVAFTGRILERFPKWAKSHRVADGPELLAADAVDILASHRLVVVHDDGSITARPAVAR